MADLKTYRRQNPFIPRCRLVTWFHAIIQALDVLHKNDVIHGDVKASNILIYENMGIKLSDFNLSMKKNWQPNCGLYTKTHRPYETWVHSTFNENTDLWALGCTFIELLQSSNLFPLQDTTASINAILDWAKSGPNAENISVTTQPCSYISFQLQSIPSSLDDLKQISFSLLHFVPEKRTPLPQLLS